MIVLPQIATVDTAAQAMDHARFATCEYDTFGNLDAGEVPTYVTHPALSRSCPGARIGIDFMVLLIIVIKHLGEGCRLASCPMLDKH